MLLQVQFEKFLKKEIQFEFDCGIERSCQQISQSPFHKNKKYMIIILKKQQNYQLISFKKKYQLIYYYFFIKKSLDALSFKDSPKLG